MKNNINCSIVQDLLPNYIDNLTAEETNIFIAEHLKECNECKKILENMKKEIHTKSISKDKREINYMKKFKSKLRILRLSILAIILMIIFVFSGTTIRKMIIISNLFDKSEQYMQYSNNFHQIDYSYDQNGFYKNESFKLDEYIKMVDTTVTDEKVSKFIQIGKVDYEESKKRGYRVYKFNRYYEDSNNLKIAILEPMYMPEIVVIENKFKTNNFWELLKRAITATIKDDEIEGKKCYMIIEDYNRSPYIPHYIDKETGLIINVLNISTEYEFGNLTNEDFIEPDIKEYKEVNNITEMFSLIEGY